MLLFGATVGIVVVGAAGVSAGIGAGGAIVGGSEGDGLTAVSAGIGDGAAVGVGEGAETFVTVVPESLGAARRTGSSRSAPEAARAPAAVRRSEDW